MRPAYEWVKNVGFILEGAERTSAKAPFPSAKYTLKPTNSIPPLSSGGDHLNTIAVSLLLTKSKFIGVLGLSAVRNGSEARLRLLYPLALIALTLN